MQAGQGLKLAAEDGIRDGKDVFQYGNAWYAVGPAVTTVPRGPFFVVGGHVVHQVDPPDRPAQP